MTGLTVLDGLVGRRAQINVCGTLCMEVTIIDVRRVYGRTEVCIAPTKGGSGTGSAWVAVNRLQMGASV